MQASEENGNRENRDESEAQNRCLFRALNFIQEHHERHGHNGEDRCQDIE